MRYATALASSPTRAIFGFRVMTRSNGYRQHVTAALDQPAQIAGREDAFHAPLAVDDDGDAAALRDHDDRLAHRIAVVRAPAGSRVSMISSTRTTSLSPERPAGMNPGEVLALESLLLQQRHRQRVAEHERRRRARRRREIVRTRLLAHPGVERDVAVSAERRRRAPR